MLVDSIRKGGKCVSIALQVYTPESPGSVLMIVRVVLIVRKPSFASVTISSLSELKRGNPFRNQVREGLEKP